MSLYDHQRKIIEDDPKECGLFLGTGSAKTRTALELALEPILVVAPKTQVDDANWERENKKWGINKDLTVISKEAFRRDSETLPGVFNTVIFDEVHTCLGVTPNTRQRKGRTIPRSSQLYEAAESYLARTKPKRLYLCTATIVKNPMTVWGAARLLGRKWDFFKFRDAFYVRLPMPGREIYAPKKDSKTKDKLAKLVRGLGYVGRLEDYFDVPDQTFRTIYCELSEAQIKRIKRLRTEFPDPIVQVGKRHQAENGVLAGDEFNEPEIFSSSKIDAILDLAEEFPRMVVFAKYRAQIEQIEKALRKEGYYTMSLTGAVKERGVVIKSANAIKACIFIAQAQISAGWELPEYPTMVFASRTYSFVDYQQALGRIQRANNIKKNLYINLVVKGGVDEAVNKSLENKQDFDERLYLKI